VCLLRGFRLSPSPLDALSSMIHAKASAKLPSCVFVSFSVNSSTGWPAQYKNLSPSSECEAAITGPPALAGSCRSSGLRIFPPHDHTLRNQRRQHV
jgi:hypothetical protein